MRSHTLHSDSARPAATALPDRRLVRRWWRFALDRFLLLPLGASIGLLWANVDPEPYFRFSHGAAFAVNEIAMVFFLGLMAQELFEALMPRGELHQWRYWSGSVVAAAGGLAAAVAAFWIFISARHELMLGSGWPVVAAVDVAAGYYVMRLIYPRRNNATLFVLLAAVVTDVVVMIAITVQAPAFALHVGGLTVLLLAVVAAAVLRSAKVESFWPYWLGCGAVSWLGCYWAGLHPAFALIPIVPFMPHDARVRGDVFADRLDEQPLHVTEHRWNVTAQIALFLFGVVNAGVILKQVDTGTWGVVIAAVVARPAGVIIAMALAASVGLGLPRGMQWRDLVVAALAMTSGFTFALFVAGIALPIGAVSDQMTVGALLTTGGALLAIGAARWLKVGRFKSHQPAR